MGGLLTLPSFTKVFPEICTTKACTEHMTDAQKSHQSTIQGIAISCYNVGCFTGAIIAMYFGQKFGRRWAIFIGCVLVSVGAVLQFASFSLPMFIMSGICLKSSQILSMKYLLSWRLLLYITSQTDCSIKSS